MLAVCAFYFSSLLFFFASKRTQKFPKSECDVHVQLFQHRIHAISRVKATLHIFLDYSTTALNEKDTLSVGLHNLWCGKMDSIVLNFSAASLR